MSGEHAVIVWSQGSWRLRDLGSSNGTTVDGRAVEPGKAVDLLPGQQIDFGGMGSPWTVVEVGEPGAVASSATTEVLAEEGFLALPPDAPVAAIYESDQGDWVVEDDTGSRAVADGEELRVGGQAWTLHLPEAVQETLRAVSGPSLADLALEFTVSRDEEHVAIVAETAGIRHELGARAHHYLLLTLARQRVADAAEPESERGWMYADDLRTMLGLEPTALNMQVMRARQQFAKLKLARAAQLIERRPHTQQLRLAIDALTGT